MARKEIDAVIQDDGRDKGKRFFIREMPAVQAEKLAMRALFAAARAGVDIPQDLMSGGMKTVAVMGVQALMLMNFYDAEPILDELMRCVQIKPDPRNLIVVRPLNDDDIEEIKTIQTLRREVLQMHLGFSLADDPSKQGLTTSAPA